MDGPGFHVEVESVEEAARGITQSVQDQGTFELRDLCGDAEVYGHAGFHDALMQVCTRWSDALDQMTSDAETVGETLGNVARSYREVEHANKDKLTGDPATGAAGG